MDFNELFVESDPSAIQVLYHWLLQYLPSLPPNILHHIKKKTVFWKFLENSKMYCKNSQLRLFWEHVYKEESLINFIQDNDLPQVKKKYVSIYCSKGKK